MPYGRAREVFGIAEMISEWKTGAERNYFE